MPHGLGIELNNRRLPSVLEVLGSSPSRGRKQAEQQKPLIPALKRQMGLYEFESILVYVVNSRSARTTQ